MTAIDPQLHEMFRDVVGDRASTWSRMPERGLRSWLERTQRDSIGADHLTKAQKHLARAHVDALVRLCCQMTARLIVEAPDSQVTLCRQTGLQSRIELPDRAEMHAKAAKLTGFHLHSSLKDVDPHAALATGAEPRRFALMAVHLLASPQTRNWLGLALHHEGSWEAAKACFHSTLGSRPSLDDRGMALINLGSVELSTGHLARAFDCYLEAARLPRCMPHAIAFWLNSALFLGERADVLRASALLEDAVTVDHPLLLECAHAIRESRKRCEPSPSYRALLREVEDRLSPSARRLLGLAS